MSQQATFSPRNRNPDVLTCIANLSNDEVFTPPKFANVMLDSLEQAWANAHGGVNIWTNPDLTYLDPFTKSGVFLREITRRLTSGLESAIPDLEARVEHILTRQVYGMGITRLTSLIARRSVYCSKKADGKHSLARSFTTPAGHIWFEPTEHHWKNGRCAYCGATQKALDRGEDRESHAYAFIHAADINTRIAEVFGDDVQFDVIIGNPPYQLADGGQGASALPIYNKFVDQAKQLNPRFLTMVIPARWFFGGRGLKSFREEMLADRRIRKLVDYPDSRQAFDSVDVAGGVCYFLWNRDEEGDCEIVSHDMKGGVSSSIRPLLEPGLKIFVRNNAGLDIVRKVVLAETGQPGVALPPASRFDRQVSGQKPFGLRTYFRGSEEQGPDDVQVLQSGGRAWVPRSSIKENVSLIDKWKVFTSKSSSEHAGQADKNGMRRVLSLSGVLPPGSVVTETYVLLGTFDEESEARNCLSYAMTKFFRFLVATRSSAQDLPRSAYSFVPLQDFTKPWTDAELYERYGLTADDIDAIESTIRPMESDDG